MVYLLKMVIFYSYVKLPEGKMLKVCFEGFSSTPLYSTHAMAKTLFYSPIKGMPHTGDRWPYPRPQILCFVHGSLWLDFRCSCRLPNQVSVQTSAVMFRAPWQRCSGRLWDRVDVDTMCRMCRVSDWFSRCNSMFYLDTSRYDIDNICIVWCTQSCKNPEYNKQMVSRRAFPTADFLENAWKVPGIIRVIYLVNVWNISPYTVPSGNLT